MTRNDHCCQARVSDPRAATPRGDSGSPLQHELGFGPGRALTGSRDRDGG